jgi:hypothetical protein|tara:strand:- start:1216 stop:1821 length:606 start_codon:yes stop_codon:yes gene_type:complete
MAKRSNLYEIYFGPADSKLGHGYGQIKNGPLGSPRIIGSNFGIYDEPDPVQLEEDEVEEVDKALITKVDGNIPMKDPGDVANRLSSYTGAYTNLSEFSDHTTTAMKGSSPNLTYRGSRGQKVAKTSMSSTTYPRLYTRPRVDMYGTYYGTSRAPLPRHNEDDNNPIFSLNDIIASHERAMIKHNNRVKKLINEINYNFYDI